MDKILKIIRTGEKRTVEFKESINKLPNNLFESICAFLNRNGGHVILGVNDQKEIIGVNKDAVEKLKKDFVTQCNNTQKINPSVYLEIQDFEIDEKTILYIFIHESSEIHRTCGKIFDRNEDGDFDITNSSILVSNMYLRKSQTYIENKIYPYIGLNELRQDLIARVRKRAIIRNNEHPWAELDDLELLKSASLYQTDPMTGVSGVTLAGILLLGKDQVILSVLPYHRTDALLRVQDIERYDDRDDIRTNLIESYDRLMKFIEKHLPNGFYLEKTQNINVRNKIAREIVANMLIHRDFSNPSVARLIIKKDELYTENANRPKMIGYIDINNYVPYPKNPIIAKFFKEIGFADELGSGVRKVTKYTEIYSGKIPTFEEDDMFRVHIPLSQEQKLTYNSGHDSGHDSGYDQKNRKDYNTIIKEFCKTPKTRQEIMQHLNINSRWYFYQKIKPLLEKEEIGLEYPDKPTSRSQRYITIQKTHEINTQNKQKEGQI